MAFFCSAIAALRGSQVPVFTMLSCVFNKITFISCFYYCTFGLIAEPIKVQSLALSHHLLHLSPALQGSSILYHVGSMAEIKKSLSDPWTPTDRVQITRAGWTQRPHVGFPLHSAFNRNDIGERWKYSISRHVVAKWLRS